MANRFFQQFFFSLNHMPVYLEGSVAIGSTGAVGTIKGSGIKNVVRLKAGIYRIELEDNYYRYLSGLAEFVSPTTGSDVDDGSFSVGTLYQITTVGTTDWHAIGVPAYTTPAVGVAFVATGVGGSGTGKAKAVSDSGIENVEIVGDPNLTINPTGYSGGYVIIQCIASGGTVADPTVGSTLNFSFILRNSNVQGKGE